MCMCIQYVCGKQPYFILFNPVLCWAVKCSVAYFVIVYFLFFVSCGWVLGKNSAHYWRLSETPPPHYNWHSLSSENVGGCWRKSHSDLPEGNMRLCLAVASIARLLYFYISQILKRSFDPISCELRMPIARSFSSSKKSWTHSPVCEINSIFLCGFQIEGIFGHDGGCYWTSLPSVKHFLWLIANA